MSLLLRQISAYGREVKSNMPDSLRGDLLAVAGVLVFRKLWLIPGFAF